ncbi:MAG: inositol monophosphatase family protein [Promethearchaeota archaeon]
MELSIDFLKKIGIEIYNKIHPILGTKKAAEEFQRGAGGDISMYIDILAEKVIVDSLKSKNVDLLLISEEIGEIFIGDKKKAINNQQKIIMDPIDGSNNAIRGIPFCSVSIAYAIGNSLDHIIKAAIIDLTTKDIYWAEKNKGAYLNDKQIYVSERNISKNCFLELNLPLKSVASELVKYSSIINKFCKIRVMGSTALTLCQIAKGSIDAFMDFIKNNRLVDVAAGILILKEAGGKIFSKEGKDLDEISLSIDTKFPFVASNSNLESFLKENLIRINL